MKLTLNDLSLQQTTILKGFAILMIVFHNYFHIIAGVGYGENQLFFKSIHMYSFLDSIFIDFSGFFNYFFSFFGHYGVQLFVFISGYGLAKKYSREFTFSIRDFYFSHLRIFYFTVTTSFFPADGAGRPQVSCLRPKSPETYPTMRAPPGVRIPLCRKQAA